MTVDAEERLDTMALLATADPADMLRQVASSAASALSRSSGSVLDGRRLNHHPPPLTVRPSRSSRVTPGRAAKARRTSRVVAPTSLTSLLISPVATYLR